MKTCFRCGLTKPDSDFYKSKREGLQSYCKECYKKYYIDLKADPIKSQRLADSRVKAVRKYRERLRRGEISKYTRDFPSIPTNIRLRIIERLGSRCSNPDCLVPGGCIDIRCLQIDHINGGGRKELKELGTHQYWVKMLALSDDELRSKHQVLCANCNWIKRVEYFKMVRVEKTKSA
jgi:hypothetical protein